MNTGETKTEITKIPSHQNNHHDDCSPFCHCTCCAGFSINHFVAGVTAIPSYQNNLPSTYWPSSVLDVALPIWQPPQLV